MKNNLFWPIVISLSIHLFLMLLALSNFARPSVKATQFIMTSELTTIAALPNKSIKKQRNEVNKQEQPVNREQKSIESLLPNKEHDIESVKEITKINSDEIAKNSDITIPKQDALLIAKEKPMEKLVKNNARSSVKATKTIKPSTAKIIKLPKAAAVKQIVKSNSDKADIKDDLFGILGDIEDATAHKMNYTANQVEQGSNANQLSATERNIIKNKIENSWYITSQVLGAQKFRAELFIRLSPTGFVEEVKVLHVRCANEQNCQALVKAAERAVYAAEPFEGFALERYHLWKELQLNFEPL